MQNTKNKIKIALTEVELFHLKAVLLMGMGADINNGDKLQHDIKEAIYKKLIGTI